MLMLFVEMHVKLRVKLATSLNNPQDTVTCRTWVF